MESNEVRAQLLASERGEAASWLAFAKVDWWMAPSVGAWAFVFVWVAGIASDFVRPFATLALIFVPLAAAHWDKSRRGVYPSGSMPREFRRSSWALGALALSVAVVGGAVYFAAPLWLAALVVGLLAATVTEVYSRMYAADAARVRRRLA